MSHAFADTCFYIALCNPKDAWHAAAKAASAACRGHVVTTEYILLELGNALCAPADRSLFLDIVDQLRADAYATFLPASPHHLNAGLQLLRDRPDKAWSLTDCISFAVMEEHGIRAALSCDHHFEQAGFHLLMQKV